MKDQLRLLRDCINNDRPAVVFQGDDFCAPEILEAAKEIYRKHGCSEEFLFDWQLLINEVKAYQLGTFIKYYKISQLIHTQSIAN